MDPIQETSSQARETVASLYFLARAPIYDTCKPYTVRFDPKGKFPYTNIENVKHDVKLLNLRPILENSPEDISWEHHGFQIIKIPQRMSYDDFNNDEVVRGSHIPHILTVLQTEFRTAQIHVLDYRVRKRDDNFPVRSDQEYQYLQPSSRVHIDYTKDAIRNTVEGYLGVEAPAILERPWQVINVWQPLRGPCIDWPLAVCDASSVDFAKDTMASDFVDSWGYSENMQVHFNEGQRWYYLRNQMPNELLVFKSGDSRDGADGVFSGAPHASFHNPWTTSTDLPRESLEIRLLATY
ncbi:putative Methyltransferase [Seiridium cardinale]|uniref:Methyltransferase n=1 Tax=Seiridium cardinale TaxID=138064 RepID=A0ABR2XRJ8_9PEZI